MSENALGKALDGCSSRCKEITVIQCTDSKRDTRAPARDLYDESGYFCDMQAWATARDLPWVILSAKHGLVHPETELAPYDTFGLTERQAIEIGKQFAQSPVERVVVCAGQKYTNPLVPELERHGVDVINPFRGFPIGKRRKQLQLKTSELEHATL